MKTKLTLSVDKDLVQYARHHARKNGQSVSGMFSSFLLAQKSQAGHKAVPKVSEMVGTLKQYTIDDSKEAVRSAYAKKHSH
jgi:negative regulator of replication initiation